MRTEPLLAGRFHSTASRFIANSFHGSGEHRLVPVLLARAQSRVLWGVVVRPMRGCCSGPRPDRKYGSGRRRCGHVQRSLQTVVAGVRCEPQCSYKQRARARGRCLAQSVLEPFNWSCPRFKKSILQVPPPLTSTAHSAKHPCILRSLCPPSSDSATAFALFTAPTYWEPRSATSKLRSLHMPQHVVSCKHSCASPSMCFHLPHGQGTTHRV